MHERQIHQVRAKNFCAPQTSNCTRGNQRSFFWLGYINGERRLSAMGLHYLLWQLLHPPSLLPNTWKSRDLGLVEHPSRTAFLNDFFIHSGKCSAWKITKRLDLVHQGPLSCKFNWHLRSLPLCHRQPCVKWGHTYTGRKMKMAILRESP